MLETLHYDMVFGGVHPLHRELDGFTETLPKTTAPKTTAKKPVIVSTTYLAGGVIQEHYSDGSIKEINTLAKHRKRKKKTPCTKKYGGGLSKQYNDNDWFGGGSSYKGYTPCYESHKALPLCDGLEIYGGSCSTPIIKDADIYIGFDYSTKPQFEAYPWAKGKGVDVYYHITDMAAPSDLKNFNEMVVWTAKQLRAGKKVHAGCIGGHGRTGTFFAALVSHMMGVEDAITYVRTNYCPKVVESKAQIDFLHKHYGITKVAATKGAGYGAYTPAYKGGGGSSKGGTPTLPATFEHVLGSKCIWN